MLLPIHRDTVDSTNLEVRRLIRAGWNRARCIGVVADEQTDGVGREGRPWRSPRGGLWMSVAWPATQPPGAYTSFPLAAAWAMRRAMADSLALSTEVKWPNDLLVRDRKLCGILCQTFQEDGAWCVLAGVGVNGNYPAADLGNGLRTAPTTLFDELGHAVDIIELAGASFARLREAFDIFEREGVETFLPELRDALAWRGMTIRAGEVTGRIDGIGDDGALLLQTPDGPQRFVAGEIGLIERVPLQSTEHER